MSEVFPFGREVIARAAAIARQSGRDAFDSENVSTFIVHCPGAKGVTWLAVNRDTGVSTGAFVAYAEVQKTIDAELETVGPGAP